LSDPLELLLLLLLLCELLPLLLPELLLFCETLPLLLPELLLLCETLPLLLPGLLLLDELAAGADDREGCDLCTDDCCLGAEGCDLCTEDCCLEAEGCDLCTEDCCLEAEDCEFLTVSVLAEDDLWVVEADDLRSEGALCAEDDRCTDDPLESNLSEAAADDLRPSLPRPA